MFTQPSPHPKLNTPLWPIVGTTHSLTDHVSGLSSPPGVSTWREPGPQPEPVWQLCNWLPSDETVSAALPGLSHQLPAPPAPRFWAWRMVCVHQEYDLIPLMPKRGAFYLMLKGDGKCNVLLCSSSGSLQICEDPINEATIQDLCGNEGSGKLQVSLLKKSLLRALLQKWGLISHGLVGPVEQEVLR